MSIATMPVGKLRLRGRKRVPLEGADAAEAKRARRAKLLRVGVVAAMLLAVLASVAVIFAVTAHADPAKNEYSLYKLSSSTSAYFGNAQSPESDSAGKMGEHWTVMTNNAANGGAMLGFPDANKNPVLKWLSSALSGSSVTYNYESFTAGEILTDGGATGDNAALLNYAYFGAALNALGLDSTSTSLSLGITNMIGGGAMLFMFVMAGIVDMFFWFMLLLMKVLNPFALFYSGIAAANPRMASALSGAQITQDANVLGITFPHPLYGLASFVGGWYQSLYDLSLALVPIFIAVLVVTLLFFRKANVGGKFKRLMVRLVFILVGVPILGGLYTGTLNALSSTVGTAGGSMGATKVVLSTYVDFERWVTVNRLYVPKRDVDGCKATISWQGSRSEPGGNARAGLRNTALCINQITGAYGNVGAIASSVEGSATDQWGYVDANGHTTGQTNNEGSTQNVIGLLLRYMSGDHVSASDFETGYQAKLTADINSGRVSREEAKVWFVDYTDSGKLKDKDTNPGAAIGIAGTKSGNPVMAVKPGAGLKGDVGRPGRRLDFSSASGTTKDCKYDVLSESGKDFSSCNMSALSMYNYLNTSFGSKSMTVYSSEMSSSGAIREQHNAVNQIGTGLMGFLYWFNSIVMLATFVIVGGLYAIAMVIGNLKRSIQAVTSIPFAMLGAVNSIAKVIVYSIAMIVELMGTIFIYIVMQNIMLSLPQIIEMPLSGLVSGKAGTLVGVAGFLATGGWLAMAVLVFSTVFMIWFIIIALKIRKGFISGVNEAVTKAIEKFTDGQVAPPSMRGPSMAGALAGGAATGAGMAAAGRMMGGGGSKGPSSSTAAGPSGVSTGAKELAGGAGGLNGPAAPGDGGPDDLSNPGGPGGDTEVQGDQLAIGTGADGEQVDENGRPIDVDDRGNPIEASGEDPGASGAVAGNDDQDRNTAASVEARGGLSTGDDQGQQGQQGIAGSDEPGDREDQKGVLAGVPASESMDPNTKKVGSDGSAGDDKKSSGSGSESKSSKSDGEQKKLSTDGRKSSSGEPKVDPKAAAAGGAAAGAAAGAATSGKRSLKAGSNKPVGQSADVQAKAGQTKTGQLGAKGQPATGAAAAGAAGGAASKAGASKPGTQAKSGASGKTTSRGPAQSGTQARPQGAGGTAGKSPQAGQPGRPGAPARAGQAAQPSRAGAGSRPAATQPAQRLAAQRPAAGGQGQAPARTVRQSPTAQRPSGGGQVRAGQTSVNVQVAGSKTFKDQRGNGGGVRAQAQRAAQRAKDYANTPEGRMVIAQGVSSAAQARQQRRGRGQERI